jgi:hypothetical protein
MGSDFSQGSINDNPVVSFDGNTIVYTERRGKVNAIFCSRKESGTWKPPIEITVSLNAGEDCSSSSLNSDGTKLFLYKTDNFDGAIYSSDYINGSWTPIKKLNKNINTKFYESHAAISSDSKKLYFTSNREGGLGNLDIYVSEKDATGDWGSAVNLGSSINTPFNEDTPFITRNDSVLYLCSEGHNSMGGFDIFESEKISNGWKTPVNMGYPLNTTDDDKFFEPANNGQNAYYSMTTGYKKKDIFFLGIGGKDVNQIKPGLELKPAISLVDTGLLISHHKVSDIADQNVRDSEVLYYTVQVMALHNPVAISYFRDINDIKVIYSETDKFYRYSTGKYPTREDAVLLRGELIRKGYPEEIFIKKVTK